MRTNKETGTDIGQMDGFWGSQARLLVSVNLFNLLLSVGLHWPYTSSRFFFGLGHPVSSTIALAMILTAGFFVPIWLAQGTLWLVARQRAFTTYFVSPQTAQRINPKKIVPFVLRFRFNANTLVAALYLPEALDAPKNMPPLTVVYLVYLLATMGVITFSPLRTVVDELIFFFVRSGAVAAFLGGWAHYRLQHSPETTP